MPSPPPLQSQACYHVFNRGIDGETLFREERNYEYFLRLYAYHIYPVAETFAYCLMGNHFHFAIRVRDGGGELPAADKPRLPAASQAFANLFNAYAKAINKAYGRTGGLFANPYRRRLVDSDTYLARLVCYIHRNPQRHGFVSDFRDWKWSSYHALVGTGPTTLLRGEVLTWFDGREGFDAAHALDDEDFRT